jgi:hypothetical protein
MDKLKLKQSNTLSAEQINRLLLDINSKVDANIYWLTTLLQNLIFSIDTLNAKFTTLDQRLIYIEGFTAADNIHKSENTSPTRSINKRFSSNIPNEIAQKTLKNLEYSESIKKNLEPSNHCQTNNIVPKLSIEDSKHRCRRLTYAERMLQVCCVIQVKCL